MLIYPKTLQYNMARQVTAQRMCRNLRSNCAEWKSHVMPVEI